MGRAAEAGVIIAGATLLVALTAAQGWCAENGVPAFATVRKSLAIVAAPEGKGFTLGTAFCIESDAKRSYFLTNAHVVQDNDVVALRLDLDHQVYRGFVVRTSVAPLDAAVIEIPKGNVPVLSLSRALPEAGAPIAIAGYPAIQLDTDLEPSVHAGLVNDVIRGYYIEHDAVTDRGNSGGPLFDPQTGLVYGIVTAFVPSQTARAVQNDIAIGVGQALPFLRNAGVTATYATPVVAAATAGSPAATPIAAWKPWASPPPDVATSPPPAPSPSHGPVAPKSDFLTCVEALEKLAYQHAVDCSITYMAGLEPDLSRLKTASASESITTLGSAFRGSSILAFAYAGLGDTPRGRAAAMSAIGWAWFTFAAVAQVDPHLYNAADKTLSNEMVSGIKELETLYPGSTAAELKVIKSLK